MSYDFGDFLRLDQIPAKYFCVSCGNIVYPDCAIKDQAACGHLVCCTCEPEVPRCDCKDNDHPFGHPFSKSVHSSLIYKEIGKLFLRCKNCKWIGTLSDYTLHRKSCITGSAALKVKGQTTQDLASPMQEMAKRYDNAHFFWSWQDEMVDGVPVLSKIKHQISGMCAYFSTSSAFESLLRIKGKNVKNLSWNHLYVDYLAEMAKLEAAKPKGAKPNAAKPNAPKKSKLIQLAEILKEKGMVEVSSAGVPLEPEIRWKISHFKKFKMNTTQGIEAAINHMKQVGPIVCLYGVTNYQAQNGNPKSAGILHDLEMWELEYGFGSGLRDSYADTETHAVCAIGIGVEDMIPYLPYQNSVGVKYQNEGYGRVLPSCILEAVGFFIDDNLERPSKRSKT